MKRFLLGIAAGLGILVTALTAGLLAGKTKEKLKSSEQETKRAKKASKVKSKQTMAAAKRPRSRKQLADRMRKSDF